MFISIEIVVVNIIWKDWKDWSGCEIVFKLKLIWAKYRMETNYGMETTVIWLKIISWWKWIATCKKNGRSELLFYSHLLELLTNCFLLFSFKIQLKKGGEHHFTVVQCKGHSRWYSHSKLRQLPAQFKNTGEIDVPSGYIFSFHTEKNRYYTWS